MAILLAIYLISLFSCSGDDDSSLTSQQNQCDKVVEIIPEGFYTLPPIQHTINEAIIEDDCLKLKIGGSGCDGSTWEIKLIDSGDIAESLPEQRFLKVEFENDEECDAIIEIEVSFDISPLQLGESGEIILNLNELSEGLNYKY